MGLNARVDFVFHSGAPLTAMSAKPVYDCAGEIPETPHGTQMLDGSRTRMTDANFGRIAAYRHPRTLPVGAGLEF
jgi:hypothetical protein